MILIIKYLILVKLKIKLLFRGFIYNRYHNLVNNILIGESYNLSNRGFNYVKVP